MSRFKLRKGETLLKSGNGAWRKEKWHFQPGDLYLTNQRLVFEVWPNFMLSPLRRMFSRSGKRRVIFDIPINQIVWIRSESYMAHKNIMVINYRNKEIQLSTQKEPFKDWKAAIYAQQTDLKS